MNHGCNWDSSDDGKRGVLKGIHVSILSNMTGCIADGTCKQHEQNRCRISIQVFFGWRNGGGWVVSRRQLTLVPLFPIDYVCASMFIYVSNLYINQDFVQVDRLLCASCPVEMLSSRSSI